ncbi:MAG TPA: glycine cleavage system protein GcvH [bacterium]|nr:glycine cleavage system protein GcvH [bacterium]
MKVREYEMPDDLYYHSEHTWLRVEDGKVRVGLNDWAQAAAGDITYVDLPFEGDSVEAGETCGKVQSSKWVGKLVAPVSGEIAEVNSELENDATLINQSCYGDGWIMVIEPSSLEEDLGNLMQGSAAAEWLESEIQKVEKEKQGE